MKTGSYNYMKCSPESLRKINTNGILESIFLHSFKTLPFLTDINILFSQLPN